MKVEIFLRASALPLGFRCPAGVRRGEVPIYETNDAATNGTAAHEALRSLAERDVIDWQGLPALCQRYGANEEEVRMLCAIAANLWNAVKASFAGATSEVALSTELAPGVTLSGHVDLLKIQGTAARAADWKTGRKDSDYSHQMRAYGALILLDNLELTEVTVTVLWVRDGEIENYTMTRADVHAWLRQLDSHVINWDGMFRPGPQCKWCPRSHECDAANALARRDVSAIADRELLGRAENELKLMRVEDIVDLHRKAETVAFYADRVLKAIKAHVIENGDVVANGIRLTIETSHPRELKPLEAWPVLEAAGFEDKDFAECMDLRITRVEKCVAEKAGRGKGAAAVRALGPKLEAANAVNVTEVQKLARKRA